MATVWSYLGVCILALTWALSHQQRFVPGVANCNYQLDVVFAIDGSNSMLPTNFDTEKAALANLVSNLNVSPLGIHVGVVLFSSVVASYPLSGDKQGIIRNITALEYPGEGTRTDVAINVASQILRERGRGGNVRKLLIIITDGRATYSSRAIAAADAAKQSGISICAVGVTDAIRESELRRIASSPQSVFYSQDFPALQQVLVTATNEACVSVATTPSPRGLDCNTQLDLIIALDGSNSMFEDNFNIQKAAIANLLYNLQIGPDDIHVGLVLFSGDVTSVRLSGNRQQILADLNAFQYPDDSTRTDLAINQASELFRNARGGNVRKVLIIITDGRATYAQEALQAAQNAKSSGISIFAVGVTDAIDQQELRSLASTPNQVVLSANFQSLQNDLVQLATSVCDQITTPPTIPTACNFQLDLIIAIDGSNSMFEENFNLQKSAIANLVNSLNVGPQDIHVGLVLFSGDVISRVLSGNKQQIIAELNSFQYPDDSTRTDLAIHEAQILFSNARGGNVRKLLIIVTDGRATYPQQTFQAAQEIKSSGVSISVVGVTDAINQQELQSMASTPQQVFHSADFASLQREVINAANQACQYITTVPPITTNAFCNDQLDLVIAIDGSNSMFEQNFAIQKTSIANMVYSLNVGPQDINVGLVLFSGDVTSRVLNGNKQQVIADINSFEYPDDATRTDLAINEATKLFGNARAGDITKLLLIVTDGRATYPQETLQAAQNAKAAGISIYVVGVTDAINQQELQSLASSPQKVFFSENFQSLQEDLIRVTKTNCFNG